MNAPIPNPNPPYYPEPLCRAEDELIKIRRIAAKLDSPTAPLHGLAFSGGGIRSATFNLGLLQALASARWLRRFDYLSTVSGGGYAGVFFGAWVSRGKENIVEVEAALGGQSESKPVRFLRENGRYLAPNGAGDVWAAASSVLRSWVAMLAVLGLFAFAFFIAAVWLREIVFPLLFATKITVRGIEVWLSPLLTIAAGVTALAAVPLIVAYWSLGSKLWRVSWLGLALVALIVGVIVLDAYCPLCPACPPLSKNVRWAMLACGLVAIGSWVCANVCSQRAVADIPTSDDASAMKSGDIDAGRRLLTDWLAAALVTVTALMIVGLADTLAASWLLLASAKKIAAAHAVLGGSIVAGKFVWSQISSDSDKKKRPAISLTLAAGIAAGFIALSLYTLLDLWALRVALTFDAQFFGGEESAAWCLGWCTLTVFLVCLMVGRAITFLNLSSHQSLYAARITRTYLGATNPVRQASLDQDITAPMPGDQIEYRDYRPHAHGGPLHLINSTVNETVSGKSQIEQRDRHGFGLTIGPAAISAGRIHHALLFRPLVKPAAPDETTTAPRPDEVSADAHSQVAVYPVRLGAGDFPLFGGGGEIAAPPKHPLEWLEASVTRLVAPRARSDQPAPPADREALKSREMQLMPVGRWVGVSGAAVSTGLGTRTSLALSFLIGLFNVRLGYWWDSGVSPSDRIGARTPPNLGSRVGGALAAMFPVQLHLTDELLARFHGPARRRWYLTDGGHFENTAAYELVRRRVPVIVVSDCGGDEDYTLGDVGSLVRLVRTDFNAEVRFLGRDRLATLLTPAAQKIIGPLDELKLIPVTEADDDGARFVMKHAALAEIIYPGDERPGSILLLVKPGVSGDEPADVLNYHAANPAFPQQSTGDQFFEEAQWESHRKLGQTIGGELFDDVTGLDLEKILAQLRATPAPADTKPV